MSRPAKIAAWTVGSLLALIALLVIAALLVGNTEWGRAFIVRLTPEVTQGRVHIKGIHGSFPAALDLDRLELSDDAGVWLSAEKISLRWAPGALLARHVKVETFSAARLHVERRPLPEKETKPSTSSSVPRTDIDHLSIGALELGRALTGDPVSLAVNGSAHVQSLQNAMAHVVARRSSGKGNYEIQLQFDPARMQAMLKLEEPANGPLEHILKVPDLGALSLHADMRGPRSAERIQLQLDAGPLQGRAQGTVDLVKNSADLAYSLNAPPMQPYPGVSWQKVDLQGRFKGPFTRPDTDGHLRIDSLQAPGGTQLASLDAHVKGHADGLLALNAIVEGLLIPGPKPALFEDSPLSLAATIKLNDPKRPLDLSATHRLFTLTTHALTAGERTLQVDLRVPQVAPLAAVSGQKVEGDARIQAQLRQKSATTHFTTDAVAHLDGGDAAWAGLLRGEATQLHVTGDLTDSRIVLDRMQLTARALSLALSGTADRTGAQELNTRLDLNLPDLTKVSPTLVGSLKVSSHLKGPRTALSADTDLTTTLSIRGSPQGALSASVHAEGLPKRPRGTVEAHGDLDGAPLQLNVSLQHDTGDLYHTLIRHLDWKSAHAEGDLTAGSDLAKAKGNLQFRLGQLSDLNRLLGSALQGSIDGRLAIVPGAGQPRAQFQLDAKNVVSSGVTANAQLQGNGPLDALDVKVAANSPALGGGPARVEGAARLNMTARELRLARFEATYHEQTLRSLSPARFVFANGFAVENLKLGVQQARIELNGRLTPTLDARASVKELKAELINAFVPGVLAAGTMQANAQIQGTPTAPTGTVHVEAAGVRAASDVAVGLPATDMRADAHLMGDTANVDARVSAGNASHLALTGRAPLAKSGAVNLKLAGSLDVGLVNPLLEARGRHATGTLDINTNVTGTAGAPEIGGSVHFMKGSLRDYAQGLSLSDINGELTGNHGLLRIERLTARAAPGSISVEGTIGVLQPKIPVDLKLTAKNAQPIASNIVTANTDANIKVTGTAREQLEVAGKVHINRADIGIPNGMPPNVAVIDVSRPGQTQAPPSQNPLVIRLNITVEAPREILVKGHGLDAELGGTLHVGGTTDAPAVTGGFELQRGFFSLASSKLTFTEGHVTFNGEGLRNKMDPTLDFTAETQAAEVTAKVRITGLADAPKVELSSTPDLPQDEILARLLFGESASQLTAFQMLQIGAALASLGSGGGGGGLNPVAKVQKALGLDRLSVGGASNDGAQGGQGSSSGGASVEAGRYVSSRVFVAVKESTTGQSRVAADVDLTKHLKLQAQLGNGNATAQGTTPENDPGTRLGVAYQFEY